MAISSETVRKCRFTSNTFLNYIKIERIRGRFANMSAVQASKEAAAGWRDMSKEEKRIYGLEAASWMRPGRS
jgi:hypothetical protein